MSQLSQSDIQTLIRKVTEKLQRDGIDLKNNPDLLKNSIANVTNLSQSQSNSTSVDSYIDRSKAAQNEWIKLSKRHKEKIINAIRKTCDRHVETLARLAVQETGLGRIEDKINKNRLVIWKTPGLEFLTPKAYTGDDGLTLLERSPYGVVAAVTPCTNPTETIICNGIGILSGGNSVVFNVHPSAKGTSQAVVDLIQRAISDNDGPKDVIQMVENPTIETAQQVMAHKGINLLVVTGGPGVVKAAMKQQVRAIAAGPGNPPVVVDETANIQNAGKHIVLGASLDNNIICSDEKEVFAVKPIFKSLLSSMEAAGAYILPKHMIHRLEKVVLENGHPNKNWVGKNANVILKQMGIKSNRDHRLVVVETDASHPFVQEEMLMPVLPIVQIKDIDEGIERAYQAEHGNRHTAVIHSTNIDNMDAMVKAMNTSIFVKNAPAYAGLGLAGEGFTSFTIAGTSGEGLTTVETFTRERRCTLSGYFNLV